MSIDVFPKYVNHTCCCESDRHISAKSAYCRSGLNARILVRKLCKSDDYNSRESGSLDFEPPSSTPRSLSPWRCRWWWIDFESIAHWIWLKALFGISGALSLRYYPILAQPGSENLEISPRSASTTFLDVRRHPARSERVNERARRVIWRP